MRDARRHAARAASKPEGIFNFGDQLLHPPLLSLLRLAGGCIAHRRRARLAHFFTTLRDADESYVSCSKDIPLYPM